MWPFCASHLPFVDGPYIPGCVDIMTEYSKNGLFFRIYYPTKEKQHIEEYKHKWFPWIPDDSYIYGFARVVMVWVLVVRLIFWCVSGKVYIPCIEGAKVLEKKKLKCIIMSHGLGGTRFLYSTTCNELASRGFLVFSIEHRDNSAGNTYYYKSEEDVRNDRKSFINYIPVKLGPNHYIIRNNQVVKRAEECTKLLKLIKDINAGNVPLNILDKLPLAKKLEFNLNDLKSEIDVDDITMMGHSFGAATALLTLCKNPHIRRGIILDAWMFPIKGETELMELSQPLIFINTQTFHISSNVNIMEKLVAGKDENKRPVYTILHTTHENQSDTVFTAGHWLNWFMKKLPPVQAMKINNSLILSFLSKNMDLDIDVRDCYNYLLLQSDNYVTGIDALKQIIQIQYKSFFKIFNS